MQLKTFPILGCCGLDCGLCPRYYTEGNSRCPGCGGPDFSSRHPSCSFITCCVKKKEIEVCAQCDDFPCSRTEDSEHVGDSFVTHRKTYTNLVYIREQGLQSFLAQQNKRIQVLEQMLGSFDDGRSKSFYCLAATLLAVDVLQLTLDQCRSEMNKGGIDKGDKKYGARILKEKLNIAAQEAGIELKLRRK